MKKKITFILFILFVLSIGTFAVYGNKLRDYYSPHVDVMPLGEYIFADGQYAFVLVNSCILDRKDDKAFAYIAEERTDFGEPAYYAKKQEINVGISDDKCTQVKIDISEKVIFISNSDRTLADGERVVIDSIVNTPESPIPLY